MDLVSEHFFKVKSEGNVSAPVKNVSFPLHDAAGKGRARVVRLLLKRGHSASMPDHEGRLASEIAREAGHHDLAKELEQFENRDPAESSSSSGIESLSVKEMVGLVNGKQETVTALISAGRIGAIDGKGDTPLHICAAKGRLKLCDLLIRAGADPALTNFEKKKPHERASENGHPIVAALLRSLLPEPETIEVASDIPAIVPEIKNESVSRLQQIEDETFDFDDFDLDFEGQETAEEFHLEMKHSAEYVSSFEIVEGRVSSLGDEDGEDLVFDDPSDTRFFIEAADVVAPIPQTPEFAEEATFRSFLDVRSGRRSPVSAFAPSTRFYAVDERALLSWVESTIVEGACSDDHIDALICAIRGSFDADAVKANLINELNALGLYATDYTTHDIEFDSVALADPEEIADLLMCICCGSNMRPGMEYKPLSFRKEVWLFQELASSEREIHRAIVSDANLVSLVVMLGERIKAGTVDTGLRTDLDLQFGRQTSDADALADALSYLVDYQNLLEDGASTSEDQADALDIVSAMQLSKSAIELIASGLDTNTDQEHLRDWIDTATAKRDRYQQVILLEHMSLVRRLASRRERFDVEVEDLFQEGVLGLMRAVELFDSERGYRLSTYAQFRIRQSIARSILDTGSLIRVPVHRAMDLHKIDKLEEQMLEHVPTESRIAKVADNLQISADLVRETRRIPRRPVTFEEAVPDCLDLESPQFHQQLARQRTEIIEEFLADMPERASDIIVRRFGLRGEDEMTLEELGTIYGVTRERIRQIEAKRLEQLGHPSHKKLFRSLI